MKWTSLQMISLGSLIFFSDRAAYARGARCLDEKKLREQCDNFQEKLPRILTQQMPQRNTTCSLAAEMLSGELRSRSVSPWKYRVDEDNSRIPSKINFAECLCQGCVINQQEDMTYNSVLVFWTVKVLKKTQCVDDPKKYVVKKELIKVPVACVCAVPNYVN